jgi:ATPase subunit of ABC transporter with duplicated ATPase domains
MTTYDFIVSEQRKQKARQIEMRQQQQQQQERGAASSAATAAKAATSSRATTVSGVLKPCMPACNT